LQISANQRSAKSVQLAVTSIQIQTCLDPSFSMEKDSIVPHSEPFSVPSSSSSSSSHPSSSNGLETSPSSFSHVVGTSNGVGEKLPSESEAMYADEELERKFEEAKALFHSDQYAPAADIFGRVLEKRVQQYNGDLVIECAETYYLYGRALYLATKSEQEDLHKSEEDEDEESDNENEAGHETEADQEESSQQIAWENLEVARVIYEKYPECVPKLSDVYLALSEISLETGNVENGVRELLQCVFLRESCLPPHDRRIAEAHYQLGLAFYSCGVPAEAHKHYSKAFDTLAAHLQTLPSDSPIIPEIKSILTDLAITMKEVEPQGLLSNNNGPASPSAPSSSSSSPSPTTSALSPDKPPTKAPRRIAPTLVSPLSSFPSPSSSLSRSSSSSSSFRPSFSAEKRKLESFGEGDSEKRLKTGSSHTPDEVQTSASSPKRTQ